MNTVFELKKAYTNPTFTKYWIDQILTYDEKRVCPYGMECVKRNYPETYALWCNYVAVWKKELVVCVTPIRLTSRYFHSIHSARLYPVKERIHIDCEGVEFISVDNICISADQLYHEDSQSVLDAYTRDAALRANQLRYINAFQRLEEYGYTSLNISGGTKVISDVAELQKALNWDAIKPH